MFLMFVNYLCGFKLSGLSVCGSSDLGSNKLVQAVAQREGYEGFPHYGKIEEKCYENFIKWSKIQIFTSIGTQFK